VFCGGGGGGGGGGGEMKADPMEIEWYSACW